MKLRVLHVEDNPVDADLLRRQLERLGSDIVLEPVPTLAAARQRLADPDACDAVLLDLKLPDGNGLQLLAEVRERQLPVAVVVLTGSGDQDAAIAALKAGADDYLIKGGAGYGVLPASLRDAVNHARATTLRRARPLRVLYAEHHAVDIDLTRRHLARHAPYIHLTVVHDAQELLGRLPEKPSSPVHFDVVLLDFHLPGPDALWVVKVLRQERSLNVPIVLVSGQGNEEVAAQALRLGVDDFITKHEGYLHELIPTLEKVESQAAMERQHRHLEDLVATRTADLAQAVRRAEQLALAKSEFLAHMSHEIRTPLNGVLGFAQIGYRHYQDSEKVRSAFDQIIASGKLLLSIINDILDFSKIEAGKLRIDPIVIAPVEVIEQATQVIAERAHAKRLDLRVELAPGLPRTCIADPLRLGQILLNLLSNAVKFTETGGVTLSASRRGDELVFRVTDTGIGMSDEQLGLLFQPFEQADGSTTRKFGGTGLGLAITKRILELMDGDIRVESQPGIGSTFEFRMPYVRPAVAAGAPASGPMPDAAGAGKPLAGISILVAEDDAINQLVLEENLREDGARVVLADNGREAVERVTQDGASAYDIVLMDIQMPEMDGYEATRRIVALAPGLPVIGQTAHAFAEEKDKCLAAGMVAHIAKPIDYHELARLVQRHAAAKNRDSSRTG